jgi:hypothetical protein
MLQQTPVVTLAVTISGSTVSLAFELRFARKLQDRCDNQLFRRPMDGRPLLQTVGVSIFLIRFDSAQFAQVSCQ